MNKSISEQIEEAWLAGKDLKWPSTSEDAEGHEAYRNAWKELIPQLVARHGEHRLFDILEFGRKTELSFLYIRREHGES